MCHKGQELPVKLSIRSHKPGVGNLAMLKDWERSRRGSPGEVLSWGSNWPRTSMK